MTDDYQKLVESAAAQALETNDMNGALRAHEDEVADDEREQFHLDVQLHAAPEVPTEDGPDSDAVSVADSDSGNADEKGA